MMSNYNGRFQNPRVGSYHVFDGRWGLICTTGFPGLPHGSAEPLVAKIVSGDLQIENVLRDIYWLSILCWTKPDGHQSDPITIKLADDWLESLAAKISDKDILLDSEKQRDNKRNPVNLASKAPSPAGGTAE